MRVRAKGIIILLLAAVFSIQTAFATTYTYDRVNRMTRVMYDDGTVSEYRFDKRGNIISVKSTQAAVISFDEESAEESFSSITVRIGEEIPELPELSRDGYTFAGWYTSEGQRVQALVMVHLRTATISPQSRYRTAWQALLRVHFWAAKISPQLRYRTA